VARALSTKLSKLVSANASRRVLLIELPTIDTSYTLIAQIIQDSSDRAPDIAKIDFVVLAKTHTDGAKGSAWFFSHDTKTFELGDVGHVTWQHRSICSRAWLLAEGLRGGEAHHGFAAHSLIVVGWSHITRWHG
jgi:hypothetical protein